MILAIGFAGLAIIDLLATWLRSYVLLNLSNALSYQIIVNLYRHLVRLPLPWFEKRHVGDIISRFGSTQPITHLLSDGMISAFVDGAMAIITLLLMFIYSGILAAVAIVALALYLGVRLAFYESLKLRNVSTITTHADEQSTFIETVRGISAIKSFDQENNRQRIWQEKKAKAINASIKLGRITIAFQAVSRFIISLERVVFIYIAISLALDGSMTIGMIFAFEAYKSQFLSTSMRLIEQSINFRIIQIYVLRISDISLSKREDNLLIGYRDLPDVLSELEIQGVHFRYGAGEPEVLSGADLLVSSPEMIAIVGPSGGGKTTLMKLLMGLFEPASGKVLVNGKPLSEYSRQVFRRRIGSVAQDDTLYAGSLAQNISFFDPEMDMDKLREAANKAFIGDVIEQMPLRYNTLVGDMGSALSGGQKQRVLLARALYPNPDILFIDEGTAALDQASEQMVINSLKDLNIMRVVIAHRSQAIMAADRVVAVQDGKVIPVTLPEAPDGEPHMAANIDHKRRNDRVSG